ncbi:MAG: CoB--CoM heterodisulfide reductase iron-sulfur subunit A family protein [Elusimicrobia bacterium]|nr:CoB--CoM heterodisulfide reductase iron-sulfur subunit A family protein [Elusimicrobiota bacterium]
MDEKIGVYVCECGPNIKNALDVEAVVRHAGGLPGVAAAKSHRLLCSDEGKAFLKSEIQAQGLTRLVIAACSPREHEATFRGVSEASGLNPFLMQMANIREHAAWVTGEPAVATAKAKAFVAAAVRRVALHQPLERKFVDSNPDALVVGGGVAGISAVAALAQKGRKAYLVERAPCLGGRVARFEDAFPRAECASCMLEPKLDKVLHQDNIQVLTYSEVEEVLGSFGNYIIKVRRKARSVDLHNCIGCGACYEPCPVQVPNDYDEGMSRRKAIYIPYTGCLPNVPVIDRETCLRFKKDAAPGQRGCDLCQKACPFGAIDYSQQDEVLEIRAGGVVLATGSALFDPKRAPQYGYGKLDNVLTGMEFARLVSQTGPTGGKVLKKDGQPPQAVALIHCVGSRTPEYNPYCSGVCCLASLGFIHMIQKQLPQAEVSAVYSELSLPGRDAQKLCDEVKSHGARFLRARGPAAARVEREGERLAVRYQTEAGRTARGSSPSRTPTRSAASSRSRARKTGSSPRRTPPWSRWPAPARACSSPGAASLPRTYRPRRPKAGQPREASSRRWSPGRNWS